MVYQVNYNVDATIIIDFILFEYSNIRCLTKQINLFSFLSFPEPRDDHAVAMTRFARDCQLRMASLSQQLEVALGPDTADLSFR